MSELEEELVSIPLEKISQQALDNLIEEYILREGTDYGHSEKTLEQKKQTILKQLKNNSAVVVYSTLTENTSILPSSKLPTTAQQ